MTISPQTIARLKEAVGRKGFTDDPGEIAPHLVEWRSKYQGRSPLLLKPTGVEEVSAILAICNQMRVPLVPQGGNTGLVGGQIPFDGEILLDLTRMNRVRGIDAEGMSLVAEAGVTLAAAQAAADEAGRYFPLSLASEGSCTIGGNVSTNAGGVNVLRYGNARDLVLGLEVVTATGQVLDLLRTLRKDNTGYDLKQLFIGAEGTLGIVTAVALKLFAKPRMRTTAFVAIRDPKAAVDLLGRLQDATGGLVSAFELLPRIGLEFVCAHIPDTHDPLNTSSPWYVLVEIASAGTFPLDDIVQEAMGAALEAGEVSDAVLASSQAQRAALWRLRENLSEAQKHEGGSIKHDVSVPVKDVPAFLDEATAAVRELVPGIRPVPFGHLGDGNIHFNLSVPKGADDAGFLARWEEISRVVHDIVWDYSGSISAEHGLGIMKREEITRYKSEIEMETMRALKRTLDPNNILNPGKVVAV
jgi:FAD/FMN-containing dehydrogenase